LSVSFYGTLLTTGKKIIDSKKLEKTSRDEVFLNIIGLIKTKKATIFLIAALF
jgi:hypothetical protein